MNTRVLVAIVALVSAVAIAPAQTKPMMKKPMKPMMAKKHVMMMKDPKTGKMVPMKHGMMKKHMMMKKHGMMKHGSMKKPMMKKM